MNGLSVSLYKEIALRKVTNRYLKGQIIFVEENPAFGLFMISDGEVQIATTSDGLKKIAPTIAKAGDLIGTMISGGIVARDNKNSATALKDSIICFFDDKFFSYLAKKWQ